MRSSRHLLTAAALAGLVMAAAGAAADDDTERASQLFQLCAQCHGSEGEGSQIALAPAIAGLGEWYLASQITQFRNGTRGMNPDDIGGLRMHPMALSLQSMEDVQLVAAYVASLPTARPTPVLEGGDPARGAPLYAVCSACHGPDGAGNPAMNAPRLTGSSDWYLLSSIQKYKAGIRGANPENPNAVLMRGMAAQLTDEQAMKDVIAYIMTLSGPMAAN